MRGFPDDVMDELRRQARELHLLPTQYARILLIQAVKEHAGEKAFSIKRHDIGLAPEVATR